MSKWRMWDGERDGMEVKEQRRRGRKGVRSKGEGTGGEGSE